MSEKARVERLASQVRAKNPDDNALDEAVHEQKSKEGRAISDDGTEAQIRYLIGAGWTDEDIIQGVLPPEG